MPDTEHIAIVWSTLTQQLHLSQNKHRIQVTTLFRGLISYTTHKATSSIVR